MAKDLVLHWQTDDVLKATDFDKLHDHIERELPQFEKWFEKLKPNMTAEQYKQLLKKMESVSIDLARLYCLPSLMEAVDEKDSAARAMKSKARDLSVKYSEAVRKISLWLKGKAVGNKVVLDDENAKRLFASYSELEYAMTYSRKMATHTLGESEENIIAIKDANGVSVLSDLRDLIEAEFSYEYKVPGKKPQTYQTASELMTHIYSPNLAEREATYRAVFAPYHKNLDKFFLIYQAVVKDWAAEAKLRGYQSSISMRNAANHIPDAAIETLMNVCRENRDIYQDFFRFKANQLGLKKLRRFDIYAPLKSQDEKMAFSDAKHLVNEAFESFSPDFAAKARQILDENHVDSHPTATKRGGAFCLTVSPDITPYVMLNYSGKARDVSTLAHELGHGVHSLYANKLPASVQAANLPLAETASTFGEMILFEKLLESASSDEVRKSMLSDKMGDSYATIMRQTYFVDFEIKAHAKMGQGLTPDQLSQMWLETLREQFGSAVEVDEIFSNEWAYIPHILHNPFYCYAYNFGELLSLSLYARYKDQGGRFISELERLLSAGGSEDPDELLRSVGVDMSDPKFWRGSFEIIKSWQKQLESL